MKEVGLKCIMLYDFIYIILWLKQSYRDNKHISYWPRFGDKGQTGEAKGNVYGSKSILYDTVIVDTQQYAFFQMHRTIECKRSWGSKHGMENVTKKILVL